MIGQIGTLDLAALGPGIPALTVALGSAMREACLICFTDQGHPSGVRLKVSGIFNAAFLVEWDGAVTAQMQRAWRDEEYATEQAACGVALLLIKELTGYTAVEQVSKGPGFDYWLGFYDEARPLLQFQARLEVSGIRRGTDTAIKRRINLKRRQVAQSEEDLPAYIVVVEFSRPVAWVVTL